MHKPNLYQKDRGSAGAVAIAVVAALVLVASTIYFMNQPSTQSAESPAADSAAGAMMVDGADRMTDDSTSPSDAMMAELLSLSGTVLAGSASPVIDFNQADFEKAKASDKLIVLYFYADWCPICKQEVNGAFYPAFESLNDPNVVAFRVNYKDSFTDDDESALAREHGIAYQHTKVFLKNGERILKSPESWNQNRYLSEIASAQ
jgi:thioredoxin 1